MKVPSEKVVSKQRDPLWQYVGMCDILENMNYELSCTPTRDTAYWTLPSCVTRTRTFVWKTVVGLIKTEKGSKGGVFFHRREGNLSPPQALSRGCVGAQWKVTICHREGHIHQEMSWPSLDLDFSAPTAMREEISAAQVTAQSEAFV